MCNVVVLYVDSWLRVWFLHLALWFHAWLCSFVCSSMMLCMATCLCIYLPSPLGSLRGGQLLGPTLQVGKLRHQEVYDA